MSSTKISLLDVAKYFRGLPHQVAALDYLDKNINPEVEASFAKKWREDPELKPAPPKGIAHKAIFSMSPASSGSLIEGKFVVFDKPGNQLLNAVATSGAIGFQSKKDFYKVGRGLLPPCADWTIQVNGFWSEVRGVDGMFYPLRSLQQQAYGRSGFGVHYDSNVPGSAGCIVIRNRDTFDKFVALMKQARTAGIEAITLEVNYE